tara:strand:- start:4178 stop:4525 length:348 start_codon:yes stop_codon:yes gene_type:complete
MENQLVDILTEQGVMLAKIVSETPIQLVVKYMKHKKDDIYDYDNPEIVDRECIDGYYDTIDEVYAGFQKVENGFVRFDQDDDYEPSINSESSTESSDDESVEDESSDDESVEENI